MNAKHHIQEIETHGYSIARDVINLDFCEEVRSEISRLEALGPPSIKQSEFTGYKTLRYFDLLNKGKIWERVATLPFVLEVVRGILGEDMLLSTMGTAVIDPGETAQAIHCDDQLYGMRRPHKHLVCNTMWALSDFTESNGATRLIDGSHKFDHYPSYHRKDSSQPIRQLSTIAAEMTKGSICFIVGTCYHGGGANQSKDRRWGLTINYCAGSQRQQENLMLAHSREKLLSFPEELQRIIGLQTSLAGVGHINAGDPRAVLTKSD